MTYDKGNITIRRGTIRDLPAVVMLNREIFAEERLINSLDHDYLLILVAEINGVPIGFKIGYGQGSGIFYSAKGGVLPKWRRQGLGRSMLRAMETIVRTEGYAELRYHTFPSRWPGMLSLGRSEGYDILEATWNAVYNDYQILLFKRLKRPTDS